MNRLSAGLTIPQWMTVVLVSLPYLPVSLHLFLTLLHILFTAPLAKLQTRRFVYKWFWFLDTWILYVFTLKIETEIVIGFLNINEVILTQRNSLK